MTTNREDATMTTETCPGCHGSGTESTGVTYGGLSEDVACSQCSDDCPEGCGCRVGAEYCADCGRSDGGCDRVEVQIPEHHGRGICTITLCGRCDTSTGFTETLDGLTIRHRCGWHHVPGSRCLCKPDIERCDVPRREVPNA